MIIYEEITTDSGLERMKKAREKLRKKYNENPENEQVKKDLETVNNAIIDYMYSERSC